MRAERRILCADYNILLCATLGKFKFLDVVQTVKWHFRSELDTVLWFDLFSNNQHDTGARPFEWWSTTFKSAIAQFGHTVLILSPWEDPVPLRRAWCLFEIYCTVETSATFEIAMCEADVAAFLQNVKRDAEGINQMISQIDTKKSEAWNPADRQSIFEVVEKTVGFNAVNSAVFTQLREWVTSVTLTHLQSIDAQIAAGDQTQVENRCQVLRALGGVYVNQGRLVEAVELLKECYDIRTMMLLDNPGYMANKNLIAATIALGDALEKHGESAQAEPLLRQAVALAVALHGMMAVETLTAQLTLSKTLERLGEYTEAGELTFSCLEGLEGLLGEFHPDTLYAMNDVAERHLAMGR